MSGLPSSRWQVSNIRVTLDEKIIGLAVQVCCTNPL
jgi:hypothetical protein